MLSLDITQELLKYLIHGDLRGEELGRLQMKCILNLEICHPVFLKPAANPFTERSKDVFS